MLPTTTIQITLFLLDLNRGRVKRRMLGEP